MPRFVFIDTEATGLDHRRHELTEVAWIVRFEDGVEETRQFFPEHTLDGAEPAALELTHYHDRIGPRPRTPATVWLRQLLADAAGGHLVGAVPDFDAHHLELMCHKLGLVPSWDHHLIDVGTLALPLIADQPEGPRSLAKTCRALGVPHDDNLAHGALYDAQQAMRAFDAVWDRLAKLRADGAPLPDAVPRTGGNGNGPRVDLVEVTDRNWRDVADVAPRSHQQQFVFPSAARYLLLADRSEWHSLGIVFEGHVVGHVMYATEAMDDPADDVDWIGGLVIDRRHQGRGFGSAAARALLDRLVDREVRLTVHPDNHTAQRMWRSLDFHPTDERDDEEVVWVRPAPGPDDGDGAA
ncbi:GNAT family N-acetyltransferase [Salsipaludibacter albus]|uniref:GNAT family N-acetyltransferase n=1 Tax=Salsipaludibacter albus TaxID=2849650 RepID=UPI001EE4B7B7|nr:GNAT family N-acetyltransferase [Salsipaludibacter albus]MBY5163504.1 GNAT family N-acetyltransferase [Salsipaludibacter albus]